MTLPNVSVIDGLRNTSLLASARRDVADLLADEDRVRQALLEPRPRRPLADDQDAMLDLALGEHVDRVGEDVEALFQGLDVFADAIDALAERDVRHRVLVIGEGPARPWFEERLPNAVFVGQQVGDMLAGALASSDVFLNPSITETFGNVTLEAMACGLPVVAAAATGASSLVRDGETGVLIEPTEIEQFADALEAYARDPDLRRRHGDAGLSYARTMDWDRINSAVVRTYLRVIEKRARLARMSRRA